MQTNLKTQSSVQEAGPLKARRGHSGGAGAAEDSRQHGWGQGAMAANPGQAEIGSPAANQDKAKRIAGEAALSQVESGMRLGLGTGSTAEFFLADLGRMIRDEGLRIDAVATSKKSEEIARRHEIPTRDPNEVGELDLTVDGADELDESLALIKGGGGALLREKIVARMSARMVVIADASKLVAPLGAFPLPVEVIRFGWMATASQIESELVDAGVVAGPGFSRIRMAGDQPFLTDEGNYILDLCLGAIHDAAEAARRLDRIPGVVEHGLFMGLCDMALIASADGSVRRLRRQAEDSA